MLYSISELAAKARISQRSIYLYTQRRLIPAPLKKGRNLLFTEEHLQSLQLVRVLMRLGLPTEQVEQLVSGREEPDIRRALAPVLPLATLLDETEARVEALQRKTRAPASEELDLSDLGLEDPLWLRHQLTEAERLQERLLREFRQAGAAVLRELVGIPMDADAQVVPSLVPNSGAISGIREQLDNVAQDLRGRLDLVQAAIETGRRETERDAFLSGLAAARGVGWQPTPATPPPAGLRPVLADLFRLFVTGNHAPDQQDGDIGLPEQRSAGG